MTAWRPADYCLDLPPHWDGGLAEHVFALVWRCGFDAPGFCVLDTEPGVDSHTLRSWMVRWKEQLSAVAVARGGRPFVYRSLARFDQQETTKFHLDGAPDPSLLMLGYEPSRVDSRLSLADYSRAAFDLGITPAEYLRDYNPMFRKGQEQLRDYVTQLPAPAAGRARILFINNSSLPFSADGTNPLGVMHQAEIINPDANERRVINSTMLVTEGEELDREKQEAFVRQQHISEKHY